MRNFFPISALSRDLICKSNADSGSFGFAIACPFVRKGRTTEHESRVEPTDRFAPRSACYEKQGSLTPIGC